MARGKKEFYLVDYNVLPEALKKTIRAKELLKKGEVETVNEAVLKLDLSRSAYYKYKDHVAAASSGAAADTAVFLIVLQDDPAAVGRLMRRIAAEEAEIILMHQGISIEKKLSITLTLRFLNGKKGAPVLAESLRTLKGVKQVFVVGEE